MAKDEEKKPTIISNGLINFYQGGIESNKVMCFIPYNSIARVWISGIRVSSWKVPLSVFFMMQVVLMFTTGKPLIIFFSICLAVFGFYMYLKYSNDMMHCLNIETSAGSIFSFTASNNMHIDKSYEILRNLIDQREENRKTGTYNFYNGTITGAIGDGATFTAT